MLLKEFDEGHLTVGYPRYKKQCLIHLRMQQKHAPNLDFPKVFYNLTLYFKVFDENVM